MNNALKNKQPRVMSSVLLSDALQSIIAGTATPEQDLKYSAQIVFVANQEVTMSNANLSILDSDYIEVGEEVVNLIEEITLDPKTLLVRISLSVGDVRVSYDATDPVKGGYGEPWLKFGTIPVNTNIASVMKFIQDGSVTAKLYVVQYGYL